MPSRYLIFVGPGLDPTISDVGPGTGKIVSKVQYTPFLGKARIGM